MVVIIVNIDLSQEIEAISLLFVAIQLSMDFDLSITQLFGFGILFQLTYETRFLSPFSVLKLNLISYQIIAQFDTYIYMYIVHRILINALICEILLTDIFLFRFVLNVSTSCTFFVFISHVLIC